MKEKFLTEEEFIKLLAEMEVKCPSLAFNLRYHKNEYCRNIGAIKTIVDYAWLEQHNCVCFINAIHEMNKTKTAKKAVFSKMGKQIKLFQDENEVIDASCSLKDIHFNWIEIGKYIDTIATENDYVKIDLNELSVIPFKSVDKRVVAIQNGVFGENTHYTVTKLKYVIEESKAYNFFYIKKEEWV